VARRAASDALQANLKSRRTAPSRRKICL